MPALVGLAAVDAFSVELPLMTTSMSAHGRIEYLEEGQNGVTFFLDSVDAFASEVASGAGRSRAAGTLRDGARRTANGLTLVHMVDAFADGIVRCLSES